MRLLRTDVDWTELVNFNDHSKIGRYAILSHTWLPDECDEVSYKDLQRLEKAETLCATEELKSLPHSFVTDKPARNLRLRKLTSAKEKPGWKKLEYAKAQAFRDGCDYLWIDTCCINKASSTELAEAINSMFRWYQESAICYVYLADVSLTLRGLHGFESARYWTRGWTLQEMLASRLLRFYDTSWTFVGTFDRRYFPRRVPNKPLALDMDVFAGWSEEDDDNRDSPAFSEALAGVVERVTGVHADMLLGRRELSSYSVAQRLSWAAPRITTRREDRAYSLLGIFGLNIPVIYGEGDRAFSRLQEELLRTSSDHTIFAWGYISTSEAPPADKQPCQMLAPSLDLFQTCSRFIPIPSAQFQDHCEITARSVKLTLPVISSPDATSRRVVLGALEDDATKLVAIDLAIVNGSAINYFSRVGPPHVTLVDSYAASMKSNVQTLEIMRSPRGNRSVSGRNSAGSEGTITVLFRSRDASLKVTGSNPKAYLDIAAQGIVFDKPSRQLPCRTLAMEVFLTHQQETVAPLYLECKADALDSRRDHHIGSPRFRQNDGLLNTGLRLLTRTTNPDETFVLNGTVILARKRYLRLLNGEVLVIELTTLPAGRHVLCQNLRLVPCLVKSLGQSPRGLLAAILGLTGAVALWSMLSILLGLIQDMIERVPGPVQYFLGAAVFVYVSSGAVRVGVQILLGILLCLR